MESQDIHKQLDHLFRKSYGKLIALFLSKYGTSYLEDLENAIMEAYYKALKVWPYKGVPENTNAWLYTTARNAFLNELKKKQRYEDLDKDKQEAYSSSIDQLLDDEIKDPELKLLFLVSHPELKKEDRLAFMLKTLSGLGDLEISKALMINKSTIKKRLQRAKADIKKRQIKFDWPEKSELKNRIELVHTSLYLLFNEGFYSSHPDHWIRKDLCLEAMRLCKYLVDHELANPETNALMSLMCYHISRYQSRIDDHGNIILLKDQDRTKWDPFFVKLGHHYLEKSAKDTSRKSKFQIEAYISAQHCMAKDLASTDWPLLKVLYRGLYSIDRQDLVLLNLIIVHLQLNEVEEAKTIFEQFDIDNFRGNKTIYYMVGVELYEKMKDKFQVELILEQALQHTENPKETKILKSKLNDIRDPKKDNK